MSVSAQSLKYFQYNIMGRDSRSRSRHRDRKTRRPHRRYESRAREPSRSSRQPRTVDGQLPSTWHGSSSHFDTNKEYGLAFPRCVESTQWTRKNNLAGVPVEDLKLVDVVPKGIQHYGMRLLANGRFTAFEMLRKRLDAMIASELFKEVYKQRDTVDLSKLLNEYCPTGEDINDWSTKQTAVQHFAP